MPFRPQVGDELLINGVTYRIAEHPAAPGIPFGQAGRRAIVYQVVAGDDKRALKVFSRRFRSPALVLVAQNLAPFASLPGLQVCQREVITPEQNPDLLRQHPDLAYTVLMPWIEGPTWMETMVQKRPLSPEESLALARSLASVLSRMEEEGLAHCDLSGPNVILPPGGGVEMVDVEEMYGPEFERPEVLSSGSGGYAHRSVAGGVWGLEGDRFAGAVMLAEMLGWCDERVRGAAWGESYFAPEEVQEETERYRLLVEVLGERWGEGVAQLFEQAWGSEQLADCPTSEEWVRWLPERVEASVVEGGERVRKQLLEAKLEAGEAWLAAGQPERAVAELEETYELNPGAAGEPLARALVALAGEREGRGDREGALAAYRRVLEVAPEGSALREEVKAILTDWKAQRDKEQLIEQAKGLERKQRWQEAAAIYRELSALADEGTDERAQWQEALARCEAEAELADTFDQALAAYQRKEWATAGDLLERVIEHRPDYERNGRTARSLLNRVHRRLNPPTWQLYLQRILPPLRRIAAQTARVVLRLAVVLLFVGVLLLTALSFAGAYAISFVAERVIATTDWGLDSISPGNYTVSEETLDESVASALELYALDVVSDVRFDLRSPDAVLLSFRLSSTPISLRARLEARDGAPWVVLEQVNGLRPYILGGIVSDGLNKGFRRAWEDSPLEVTSIRVEEREIDVTLQ